VHFYVAEFFVAMALGAERPPVAVAGEMAVEAQRNALSFHSPFIHGYRAPWLQ
jgi:hypothetical protein